MPKTDLLIYHCADAQSWAEHFKSCLTTEQLIKVESVNLDEFERQPAPASAGMLIISPNFQCSHHRLLARMKVLMSNIQLAIAAYLGLDPEVGAACIPAIPQVESWIKFTLTADPYDTDACVKDIQKLVVDHKSVTLPEPVPTTTRRPPPPPPSDSPPSSPPLDKPPPLAPKKRSNAEQPTINTVSVFPSEIRYGGEMLYLLSNDVDSVELTVQMENRATQHQQRFHARRRQKQVYQLHFKEPSLPPGLIHTEVFSGQTFIGSTSFTYISSTVLLEQVLQEAINPLQLLCDCLGVDFSNKSSVDQCLTERLKAKSPAKLSKIFTLKKENSIERKLCGKELPTLLHLTAKYNLPALTRQLLQLSGCERALAVTNDSGKTPLDLAAEEGHNDVMQILNEQGYEDDNDIYLSLIGEEESLYEDMSGRRRSKRGGKRRGSEPAQENIYDMYGIAEQPRPSRNVLPPRATPGDEDATYMSMTLPARPPRRYAAPCPDDDGTYADMSSVPPPPTDEVDSAWQGDGYVRMKGRRPSQSHIDIDLSKYSLEDLKQNLNMFQVDKDPLSGKESTDTLVPPADDFGSDEIVVPERVPPAGPDGDLDSSSDDTSSEYSSASFRDTGTEKRPSLDEIMNSPMEKPKKDPRILRLDPALQELLEIQEDFKESKFNQQDTYIRFRDWQKKYPQKVQKEKKSIMSVLRGRLRKKSKADGIKPSCPLYGDLKISPSSSTFYTPKEYNPPPMPPVRPRRTLGDQGAESGLNYARFGVTRPDSTISNASTTSGTSSRSSGISIGGPSPEENLEESPFAVCQRRFNRYDRTDRTERTERLSKHGEDDDDDPYLTLEDS